MEPNLHYETAAIAINELRRQGFSIDFNLEAGRLMGPSSTYEIEKFWVRDIYCYQANTATGDEVVVYAIESDTGEKGIYVAVKGIALEEDIRRLAARLRRGSGGL